MAEVHDDADPPRLRDRCGLLGVIVAAGLALRLLMLPLSHSVFPDTTARIEIARDWLQSPHLICEGVWGPLHTYVIAAALMLSGDPWWGSALAHILLVSLAVIPLYAFTRAEVSRTGALIVAAMFQLWPLQLRYASSAMAEIACLPLIATALALVSRCRRRPTVMPALLAGAAITLASALRYEAWLLIPPLAVLLWPRWRLVAAFLGCGLLFPLLWMAGNAVHHGDPLYHIAAATTFQIEQDGINDRLGAGQIAMRIAFYPWALFWGLTPGVALLVALGIGRAVRHRDERRRVGVWLLPPVALLGVMIAKAATGSLYTQSRYALIPGLMLLPFAAGAAKRLWARRPALVVLVLASQIPLSYASAVWPLVPPDIRALPRLAEPRLEDLSHAITDSLESPRDGVILDFMGYTESQALALSLYSDELHRPLRHASWARHQPIDWPGLASFVRAHPEGVLTIRRSSRFAAELVRHGDRLRAPHGLELTLERIGDFEDLRRIRYAVDSSGSLPGMKRIVESYDVEVHRYRVASAR